METKWNDEEDHALRGLSMLAQVMYLRVFRRFMNYRTGVSGADFRITYQVICDAVGFVPDWGSKKPRWSPSREEVRAAIRELERVVPKMGRTVPLLVDNGSCLHHGYIKKLPLASVDPSVQKRNPKGTPKEPHMANPAGNDTGKSRKDKGKQSGCSHEQRNEPHDEKNAAPAMNPSTSGIRIPDKKEKEPPKVPPFVLPPSIAPDVWAEWEAHRSEIRKPMTDRARWMLAETLSELPADVQRMTVKRSISCGWTGLFPPRLNGKVNGHDNTHLESAAERRARINAEFIGAGRRAFESEMG